MQIPWFLTATTEQFHHAYDVTCGLRQSDRDALSPNLTLGFFEQESFPLDLLNQTLHIMFILMGSLSSRSEMQWQTNDPTGQNQSYVA